MTQTILLIEDDPSIVELVRLNLSQLGYEIEHVANGEDGVLRALSGRPALVLLDVQLPHMNGLDVCKAIRSRNPVLPIIMLTSRSGEIDKVLGLELGADDYITKPFSVAELVARIRTRLRATGTVSEFSTAADEIRFDGLTLDLIHRTVRVNDELVELTARDFDLLSFLASHPGRPFTRDELLEHVWGTTCASYEENVNSAILRLRKKVERDLANPRYIHTIRGVGYKFQGDPPAEPRDAAKEITVPER